MRGGNLIIDLKNINHPIGTAVNHPGIYGLIESTRKPVRICNLVIDSSERQDVDLTSLSAVAGTYKAIIILADVNYDMVITNTDDVTITVGQ